MKGLQRIFSPPDRLDDDEGKPDPKRAFREKVNLILPDSLMIVLALIMVPVVVLQLLDGFPEAVYIFLSFIDYAILGIFIIEYVLKTIAARNILKHIINPWHLLDLLIIVIPVINLLTSTFMRLGTSSLLLRLFRIFRLLAIGGRAIDRKVQISSSSPELVEKTRLPLQIQVIDGTLENRFENVSPEGCQEYLHSPSQTWIQIAPVSETDLDLISNALGVPKIILESELIEDSYPRVDHFEHFSTIFARIADMKKCQSGPARFSVSRTGLLTICWNRNVITLSKSETDLFNQILEKSKKVHNPEEPVVITILYTIMKHILEKDKQIVTALEGELMTLENIPLKNRPASFLETTFYLRKEVNQLVPSLLHLKEIISMIAAKRIPLEGFNTRHANLFDILMDEAAYLHETASNVRNDLQSLIDLYINTTSYQTNRVMRVIAVITSLGIIPALMGLLGSNIVGNPWDIQLWQVFTLLGILMFAMGWVFYRLGWLKG
jgi:Mg2+ and Co2+ transporter CorA